MKGSHTVHMEHIYIDVVDKYEAEIPSETILQKAVLILVELGTLSIPHLTVTPVSHCLVA